jgi:hypothetical protein
MKMPERQPLLTLEHLVSSLSIFDVTMEHDSVYALLAIAKDAVPSAGDTQLSPDNIYPVCGSELSLVFVF